VRLALPDQLDAVPARKPLTPDETAAQIAAWARRRLAAVCSGDDA
jgi:hypothetical protein